MPLPRGSSLACWPYGQRLPPAVLAVSSTLHTRSELQATCVAAASAFSSVTQVAHGRLAARAARHLLLSPLQQAPGTPLSPPPSPSLFLAHSARGCASRLDRLRMPASHVQWHHPLSASSPAEPMTHSPAASSTPQGSSFQGAAALHMWQQASTSRSGSGRMAGVAKRGPSVLPPAVSRALGRGVPALSMYGTRRDMTPTASAAAGLPFEIEGVFCYSGHPPPSLLRSVHASSQLTLSEGFPDCMGSTQLPSTPPVTVYSFEGTGARCVAGLMQAPVPALRSAAAPPPAWVAAACATESAAAAAAATGSLQSTTSVSNAPLASLRASQLAPPTGAGEGCRPVGGLCETQPLFRHIMNSVLSALSDIQRMCSYTLTRPLDCSNVFLGDGGTRVLLGGVPWGDSVPEDATCLRRRADCLLASLGRIARGLLQLPVVQGAGSSSSRAYTVSGAERGISLRAGESALITLPWGAGRAWSSSALHSRCVQPPVSIVGWRLFDEGGAEMPVPWEGGGEQGGDTWDVVSAAVVEMHPAPALGVLQLQAHSDMCGSSTLVLYEHAVGAGLPAAPALTCHISTHAVTPSPVLAALLQTCDAAEAQCSFKGGIPSLGTAKPKGDGSYTERLLGLPPRARGPPSFAPQMGASELSVLHVGALAAHPYFSAASVEIDDVTDDFLRHFHSSPQEAASASSL